MFVKLLGSNAGEYRILEVISVAFRRLPEPCAVCNEGLADERTVALHNPSIAFVLNDDGKTIDKFYTTTNTDRKTDR